MKKLRIIPSIENIRFDESMSYDGSWSSCKNDFYANMIAFRSLHISSEEYDYYIGESRSSTHTIFRKRKEEK